MARGRKVGIMGVMSKKVEEKKGEKSAQKTEKAEKTAETRKSEKKRGFKKIWIVLGVILVALGGGIFLNIQLKKPKLETEVVEIPEAGEEFFEVFRGYLISRLRYTKLTEDGFRKMTGEEISAELAEIREGFSKAGKEAGKFENTEFSRLSDVVLNDSTIFLRIIKEIRSEISGEFSDEADRQLKFIQTVQEKASEARSGVYLSGGAYQEDASGVSTDGILIGKFEAMIEVGEGVMNIFVGNAETGVVGLSSARFSSIKRVEGKGLYVLIESGELIKIGEGTREEIEIGKLKEIEIVEGTEGKMTVNKNKRGIIGESTGSLSAKLEDWARAGVVYRESADEGLGKATQKLEKGV